MAIAWLPLQTPTDAVLCRNEDYYAPRLRLSSTVLEPPLVGTKAPGILRLVTQDGTSTTTAAASTASSGQPRLRPLQHVTKTWSGAADEWTSGWHAREWNEGDYHASWPRFRNVSINPKSGETVLKLSSDAEAGLQYGEHRGTSFATEMEFTVQNM